MSLKEEIAKLIKVEGYKLNDAIIDAIEDLVEVVTDENLDMEDGEHEEDY